MTRQNSTQTTPSTNKSSNESLADAMGQTPSGDTSSSSVATPITSLVGREVYTSNGVFIGEIEDLKLDFRDRRTTRLVLEHVNEDVLDVPRRKSGVLVPYRLVQSIGDIVVIADVVEKLSSDESQ